MIQFSDRTVFDPEALGARNADPIGFLDGLFTEAAAEGRSLMGFKHFAHLSSVVAQAAIADPATKLIHIRRGNFLAQYSSEKIAKSNGKWFSRLGERPEQVRINFDRDDFEAREQYQHRIECEWMNLFAFREGPRPCDAGAAFPVSWRGNRKRWGAAFPEAEYHSDLGSLPEPRRSHYLSSGERPAALGRDRQTSWVETNKCNRLEEPNPANKTAQRDKRKI
ncbi:hypothetical protein [Mesorhizobium sp.]|uniref:hypothetical protein n=1 Tax=Mesorhizobium sp. TaxID=1871066 RepID=UPI000FEA65A0|nr:hypothetical protein [Mesorhizobium sp.]RWN62293.1 MAG: hypothetical protein EOS00_06155 [Mesorhizobium sp.]